MTENEAITELEKFINPSFKATALAISALEKQIPKKPKHEGCYDAEGVWHEWIGINGRPYELCPNCETNLCCEMPYDKKTEILQRMRSEIRLE